MVNNIIQNRLVRSYFMNKSGLYQILFLLTAFCVLMVGFRIIYTGEGMFAFLVWNLFLAYLPYSLSSFIAKKNKQLSKPLFVLLLVIWLLLIPNSFYIITDLFHLRDRIVVPLWYDLALIIAFAWNGLMVGILSVRQVERTLQSRWHIHEWLFVLPLMYLNALGIFIGRYLRFNSWDIVSNPLALISDVGYLLIHPIRNRFDWSMIICFALLLSIIYLTLKKMSKDIIN
ncbi:MAG TPA: DUF1361 domain-containing protein [Flavisolibacter sp.]|nr:DUF1361 domain-containing protein [Flavisolibacter sp.]